MGERDRQEDGTVWRRILVANLQALLRRLAEMEPGDLPVLSIYLDMRPQTTGEDPVRREGLIILKDRLTEIEKTFLPRGPKLDSFREDAARIQDYLNREFPPEAQGLAVFACAGRQVFETVEASAAFDNQVTAGPTPDLFQLARHADDLETAVVALVDTNTARIFVTRQGWLQEVGGPDDDNKYYGKRQVGGWSQSRYQRFTDDVRAKFAGEVAGEIDRLVQRVGASHVILAGDEVAIPHLRDALPRRIKDLVHEETLRIDMRAPQAEVQSQVAPLLLAVEADESRSLAERLIEAVRANSLGVSGVKATRRALEQGRVDTLLIDQQADLDEETRGELVRLAATTSSHVEVVEGHEPFLRLGGVGALLRYRYD